MVIEIGEEEGLSPKSLPNPSNIMNEKIFTKYFLLEYDSKYLYKSTLL